MNLRSTLPALALVGLAAGAVPGIALAQTQESAQPAETQATNGDTAGATEAEEPKTKRVCVMEKPIGSNFPRKVCRTVRTGMGDADGQDGLDDLRAGREAQQNTQRSGGGPL